MLPGIDASLDADLTRQFDAWARRYRGRRHAERRRLLLFALEREQIVAVAYRESVLAARVDALDAPEDVKHLMRRALAWVWRDEELHVEWLRGQLRHEHRPASVAVLAVHQLTGIVGAWVTTTRVHPKAGRWVAERIARVLLDGARLTGRMSGDLAGQLRRQTFQGYATLNVCLERTAERGWLRLAELTTDVGERAETLRVADDEGRHRMVFAALAAMLDDDDRLRPGAAAADLAARLAEISPWFLPADERPGATRTGIGSGAQVHAAEGPASRDPDEPTAVAARIAALRDVLDRTGALEDVHEGSTVAVRASFMFGFDRRDRSVVTDAPLLDALVAMLRERGAADVAVIDAPTIYDRYVGNRSVAEVAAYFDLDGPDRRIVDAEADQVPCAYPRGLGRATICKTWLDADVRVVLAKARTDPSEHANLGLCTLEGLSGRIEETVYVGRYTDFRSATMMAIDLAPPHLSVIDGWGPVADGPVGLMGCARPAAPGRLYAGTDALAVDRTVLRDMGADDSDDRPMIAAAAQWLGVDLARTAVTGTMGQWGGGFRGPNASMWHRMVCRFAYPVYVWAGSQGERFVPRFDPVAFPDLVRPRWDIRWSRSLSQRAFGVHAPRP